jgi:integrase
MIDNFLSSRTYAETTKRTYANILSTLLTQTDPATLTPTTLLTYIQSRGWGNARQCLALACITTYLKFTYGNSHPAVQTKIKRSSGKLQRSITQSQLNQLLATFDRFAPKGARDLAIAAMLSQTGFRASEICRIQQSDVDTERGLAQVVVKGGNWEIGIFKPDTAAHIEWWKSYREKLNPMGYLFVSLKPGYIGDNLTPEGLNRIVAAWGRAINIQLSPHDFRRSFATITSENGGPDGLIMDGGRWHDQKVFNRYTRTRRLDALRKFLPSTTLEQDVPK